MLVLFILLFLTVPASADVFVIFDKDTKEVLSAIEEDLAVAPDNAIKYVIQGETRKSLGIKLHPSLYKFIDGKFVQDNDKISKRANEKIEVQKNLDNEEKIQTEIRAMAVEKLKVSGELPAEYK
jgi:hypothetical protein